MKIIAWNDYNFSTTIRNGDGTPVDITGCTIYFTVKDDSYITDTDDTDAIIQVVNTVHTDPTNWVTTFVLTHAMTEVPVWEYNYDIAITYPSGNKTSSAKCKIKVIERVTQS